jgi:uncharacterized membrane protein YbhN (UPF0104 family)
LTQDAPTPPNKRKGIVLAVAKLAFGLALLVVLVRYLSPSWAEIEKTIDLQFAFMLVALGGTAVATAVSALRWRVLAEVMGGERIPFGIYFHYLALTRLVGQFTSVALMDTIGRGAAVRAAASDGPRFGQHLGALIVERALDLLLPTVLLGWALASYGGHLPVDPWVSAGVLGAVFFVVSIPLLRPLTRFVGRVFAWVQSLRKRTTTVDPVPITREVATKVAALSLARFVAVVVQFWGTAATAGLALSLLTVTYATPVSQLAAFVGLTPGGLGIQDAGWAGAFSWLGAEGSVVAAFLLVTRALIVLNFAVLSALSYPFARRT